jgi:hypothetical protein
VKIDKLYISLSLSLLCLIFSIWSYLNSNTKDSSNSSDTIEKYFVDQRKSIDNQNQLLIQKLDSLEKKIDKNQMKLVQLQNQKKEIEYVYQNKINQIDTYYTNGIVNEFNLLFSKGNFRK